MQDALQLVDRVLQLKAFGISISIDDFGTGYSSLAYLKRFAVNRLKVDRSFIGDLRDGTNDAAIACTIIVLGHTLSLRVVAEGVDYAVTYPQHVDKLVLLDTVPVASEFLTPLNDNIFDRLSTDERERVMAAPKSASPEAQRDVALLQATVPPGGYDFRTNLKDFERPVLVLSGRQDPMDPLMASETAAVFKHSTLRFIDRAGHFSWFEQPRQFDTTLNAFLRD